MRDVLIHRYAAVDLDIVWEVAENRVTPLTERISKLLEEAEES
jgi:uncharacterized protein with HEPN domain